MKKRTVWALAALVLYLALSVGCGAQKEDAAEKRDDAKKEFTIVTSFYPMYIATLNIARDVDSVVVHNMTKPQTGCLHDYQLTPEDLKTLEKADAFVVNGAGMESFLEKATAQRQNLKIVEASQGIDLLDGNPHVWVSVTDAIRQVSAIAKGLAAADPAHAAQYEKNAAGYIEKLQQLKSDMHKKIDGLPARQIITFHEAFPYFAREFNLDIVDVVEREPGSEPSPKEIEDVIAKVKQHGVKALFAEPQYPGKTAEMIARESGAKVYQLDPVVTGEAGANAYDDYIHIMEKNADILAEALQ